MTEHTTHTAKRKTLRVLVALFLGLTVLIVIAGIILILQPQAHSNPPVSNLTDAPIPNIPENPNPECYNEIELGSVNPFEIDVIGDSLIEGSQSEIGNHMGVRINGMTNRPFGEIFSIINEYGDSLRPYLVIGLANNALISQAEMDRFMQIIGSERKVLFILGYSISPTYTNITQNNEFLRETSARYSNVYLANWPYIAQSHPEYLATDGIHFGTQIARQAYADLIFGVNARMSSEKCSN
ncbi:MAG: hypothetical protein LBC43_01455 [Bifidobacteriaceae bacterium]|jgi:hypothetical protein|nr:hypothetical protein [Bifidobacteriaceae bacterium]